MNQPDDSKTLKLPSDYFSGTPHGNDVFDEPRMINITLCRILQEVRSFNHRSSTSTPTRAEEISESLKSLNLNPFINKVQVDGMVRYTIIVGPKIDKKRALVDKELIDKSLGTASMVIPFNLSDM